MNTPTGFAEYWLTERKEILSITDAEFIELFEDDDEKAMADECSTKSSLQIR